MLFSLVFLVSVWVLVGDYWRMSTFGSIDHVIEAMLSFTFRVPMIRYAIGSSIGLSIIQEQLRDSP